MILLMMKDENARVRLKTILGEKKCIIIHNLVELNLHLSSIQNNAILFVDTTDLNISFTILKYVNENFPLTKSVLMSNFPHLKEGMEGLKYNIRGYCNILISDQNLKNLIKQVSNDMGWFTPEFINSLVGMVNFYDTKTKHLKQDLSILSRKELEIAGLVSRSYTNKDISKMLKISERTVKAHISACFEKFHINDRVSLAIIVNESKNDI